MKTALSLFVMVVSCAMPSFTSASQRNEFDSRELLSRLDKIVETRDRYYDNRKTKADSIKNILDVMDDVPEKLDLYDQYGALWTGISSDSAINIYGRGINLAHQLGDSCYVQRFMVEQAHAYFKRGQLLDCLTLLKNLEHDGVCRQVIKRYHHVSAVIFCTLGGFYTEEENMNNYLGRGHDHINKILPMLDPESPLYDFCEALGYFSDGQLSKMAMSLQKVLGKTTEHDNLNELAHTLMGEYYMRIGNNDEAVRHYACGAMGDIELANLDEVALMRLGELLYRMGDTSRAYNYLAVSLENALNADMKFNLMRLNDAFTDVSKQQNQEKHKRVSLLVALVVILVVLLIVVAKMIAAKRREVKHLRMMESRLARANLAKETYIAEFMNLCSSYIESLEDYNRMSKRKITAGQTDELLAYIKSGKIIEEQRHKFYDVFDDALLHIFPNYIADVNKLLQPDKQIVTSSPKVLTTELRVLALSRLGIEDASIIARFLGITTNTIYTYRNKLRTRAINRTTFEDEARKIGVI